LKFPNCPAALRAAKQAQQNYCNFACLPKNSIHNYSKRRGIYKSENAQEKKSQGWKKEPNLEKKVFSRRTFLAGATSAAALAVVGTLPAACAPRVRLGRKG
jgi:hypothetical protein